MIPKQAQVEETQLSDRRWLAPVALLLVGAVLAASWQLLQKGSLDAIPIAWAFSAGMLATVNPCGWAMMPSYAAYYLGSREAGYEERPLYRRAAEGLYLGLLMAAGFLLVFSVVGAVVALGLRIVVQAMPFLAILVGAGLVALGLWLLFGGSLPISVPTPNFDVRARSPKSVFLYGLAYGFASLSCTLPIFMAVVGSSLATGSASATAAMFGGYGAGMTVVLMAVVVSIALVKGSIVQQVQKILPYVHRLGAGLLVVAGAYLIWYQARFLPFYLAGF